MLMSVALSGAGCAQETPNPPRRVEGGSQPPESAALIFQAPSEWVSERPSSGMRRAQYRLAREEGDAEDAELTVFYFPGQGGAIQANIDRWVGMFT